MKCIAWNEIVTTRQTQFARLLSHAHALKINRDHRARLVSSNRESFAYTNSNTILLLYAGDIRVPLGRNPAGAKKGVPSVVSISFVDLCCLVRQTQCFLIWTLTTSSPLSNGFLSNEISFQMPFIENS